MGAKSSVFAFLRPFDSVIWMCILLLTILYSILYFVICHLTMKRKKSNKESGSSNSAFDGDNNSEHSYLTWENYLFFIYGKILLEGKFVDNPLPVKRFKKKLKFKFQDVNLHHEIESLSERILLLSWWIFAILFNSLYTSVLVSLLLVTEFGPEISKVEELAFRASYSLCLQGGGTQADIFSVNKCFFIVCLGNESILNESLLFTLEYKRPQF